MHDRSEWHRGANLVGRKKSLVEFSRPCATCGKPFFILVTERVASGEADTNRFGLKNCEEHRRSKPARQDPATELAALQVLYTAQARENQQLKAKLAALELFSK